MRAAAVALVLIVGAAVVLWFANTLNSWVLGGLIGGLAALLLSIPISLLIFLSIARRHEDKLQTRERELAFLTREYLYEVERQEMDEGVYEAEAELIPQERVREGYDRRAQSRQLPAADYPRLPAAGQTHAAPRTTNVLRPTNTLKQTKVLKQQPKPTTPLRNKNTTSTRNLPAQSSRNPHLTSALHQMRREALNQQENDIEVVPHTTSYLKKAAPATRSLANQKPSQNGRRSDKQSPRSTREPAPPARRPRSERERRAEEAELPFDYTEDQFGYGYEDEETNSPSGRTGSTYPRQSSNTTAEHLRDRSRQTDEHLRERFRETDAMPRYLRGQTDQVSRRDLEPDFGRTTEAPLGSLKNPLVRRPPYLYEDDPLREELSRQIDESPVVRRTTRATRRLEAYDDYNKYSEFEDDL